MPNASRAAPAILPTTMPPTWPGARPPTWGLSAAAEVVAVAGTSVTNDTDLVNDCKGWFDIGCDPVRDALGVGVAAGGGGGGSGGVG